MLVAFTLGLLGNLGHCVGMCSGVVMLLNRRGGLDGARLPLVHAGRLTTYALLGAAAGLMARTATSAFSAGYALFGTLGGEQHAHTTTPLPLAVDFIRGGVAVLAGLAALYMVLAILGRAPSPERLVSGATRRWGRGMQRLLQWGGSGRRAPAFGLGMAWGLLPCGLVLAALLTAVAAASPAQAALTMLAFGLGTLPALLGIDWITRRGFHRVGALARPVAAFVVLVFGTQLALRGLAAWGWVQHFQVGGVMVW